MNWIKVVDKKPKPNESILVAWGYIFEDDDFNITGYSIKKFKQHELTNMQYSNNNKYCLHNDSSIICWCEIEHPIVNNL